MRVADSYRYEYFKTTLTSLKEQLAKSQDQISSGKKISAPSDDPVAFAKSVGIDAQTSLNDQMKKNLQTLKTSEGFYESTINSVQELLSSVKEIAVAQANDTMAPSDRKNAADQVKGIIEQLVTLGNTKVGNTYIFGGTKGTVAPFVLNSDYSVTFRGSTAVSEIYADKGESAKLKTGMSGAQLFYDKGVSIFDSLKNFMNALENNSNTQIENPSAVAGNQYAGQVYSNSGDFYTGAGNKRFLVEITHAGTTTGDPASRAKYKYSTDDGLTWSNDIQVTTGGADTSGDTFVIDGTNNTLYQNGMPVALDDGTYTGQGLAAQIQTKLGVGYAVSFDNTTKKFSITNNTGAPVTLDWSNAGATAASLLGFQAIDSTFNNGESDVSDGGAGLPYHIIVDNAHNTFYLNGAAVTLTAGTYTGQGLAAQIQVQLGVGYAVSFDDVTRKFTIANNTGADVTLNWSNGGTTAAGLLGFDRTDATVKDGTNQTSDGAAQITPDIVIDSSHNTLYRNGTAVTLNVGTYTGQQLAAQIQVQLGAGYAVSFDNSTRKFTITNNTGADVTLNWSRGGATAAGVLGFDNVDTTIADTKSDVSDTAAGALGGIVIDSSNNTFYRNGTAVTLTQGRYSGEGLAAELAAELGPGYGVSYDSSIRKFTITNNTGADVTLNWSNEGATAAGVLGFDTKDSTVLAKQSKTGDFDAGTFVDGANVVNAVNGRVKILFGTGGTLQVGDRFTIDVQTVKGGTADADSAIDIMAQNLAYIGAYASRIDSMANQKDSNDLQLAQYKSDLVDTDVTAAITDFTALSNAYQSMLYTVSRMQSLNLVAYLPIS